MKTLVVAAALLSPLSISAAELSLDDIVTRARAVADKKPHHVVCKVNLESQLFGKSGELEHKEVREGDTTFDGDKADVDTKRAWRDGKPLTEETLKSEREKMKKAEAKAQAKTEKNDDDFDLAPLESKNAAGQSFELVGKQQLWGHDVYVLMVAAKRPSTDLANGTVWLDADSFVQLKAELVPARLPEHADWVKTQTQFALFGGVAVPTYLHVMGAGHFLMFKKTFEMTMKWSSCK